MFVTNVRGEVQCVSLSGEVQWKTQFVRLERMAPSPIYDEDSNLVGLAVVSFESVHILDARGHATQTLTPGEPLTLEFECVARQPVDDADSLDTGRRAALQLPSTPELIQRAGHVHQLGGVRDPI